MRLHRLPLRCLLALSLSSATLAANAAPADCRTRVNDTPDKLLACITTDALWSHLVDFQAISDQNPDSQGHGNRDAGTPGYLASVNYVADLMRQAGYQVTVQTYTFNATIVTGTPTLALDGRALPVGPSWSVARNTAGGSVHAQAQPVGGSGDGCAEAEFAGFNPGRVAVLRKGACALDRQAENAARAGAAAVVIYNPKAAGPGPEADRNHGAAYLGRLARNPTLPVLGVVSNSLGTALAARGADGENPWLDIEVPTTRQSIVDYNVIADSPYGSAQHVVVVDGHLDSIYGAGMLDNASGSATMLEIALNLAQTPTRNKLRYIWFGGEELGLHGSAYYTKNLKRIDRRRIAFDIDIDVTATPNKDYLIADPAFASNRFLFPARVIPGSAIGTQAFKDFFAGVGVPVRSATFGNDGTDSNSFSLIGIPNTGILTEQDCCKEQWEVDLWGGTLGNYEGNLGTSDGGCVDRPKHWCDNLANNDPVVLTLASQAAAYVVLKMAGQAFAEPAP